MAGKAWRRRSLLNETYEQQIEKLVLYSIEGDQTVQVNVGSLEALTYTTNSCRFEEQFFQVISMSSLPDTLLCETLILPLVNDNNQTMIQRKC